MNEQAAAARRAYKRRWAKENPEKVKAYRNKWYLKKYEELTREQNEPK